MNYTYTNGNRLIKVYSNGTKQRFKKLGDKEAYLPQRPENIDLNLSYQCSLGCPYCYLRASPSRKQFIFDKQALDKIFHKPFKGLEIAMNLNEEEISSSHISLFSYLRNKNFIPNLTINVKTFLSKYFEVREKLNPEWIGISCDDLVAVKRVSKFIEENKLDSSKLVIHLINKIFNPDDLKEIPDVIKNILILGFKSVGRGLSYDTNHRNFVLNDFERFHFGFDNLALEQIDMTKTLNYDLHYLGDDGTASFYIDLVDLKFSQSSTLKDESYMIEDRNLTEMFKKIRK